MLRYNDVEIEDTFAEMFSMWSEGIKAAVRVSSVVKIIPVTDVADRTRVHALNKY